MLTAWPIIAWDSEAQQLPTHTPSFQVWTKPKYLVFVMDVTIHTKAATTLERRHLLSHQTFISGSCTVED